MDFASKLNAPCRVIIAVQLTFDSISQKEAFLIANQDLRSDIVKSSNSSLEIDCSNALFLYVYMYVHFYNYLFLSTDFILPKEDAWYE